MITTETPLNELESSNYKRRLLCAYQPRSKHLESWQELKYSFQITYSFDSRIPHNEEVIPTALSKLKRKDHYFAEFCRLEFGEELRIFSRTDWVAEEVTTWLLKPGQQLPPQTPRQSDSNSIEQRGLDKWLHSVVAVQEPMQQTRL